MNEVFISGEVISEVEYKFIINGKKNAVVKFKLKLDNNSKINCIAYDEVADYCYGKLKLGKYIGLHGRLKDRKADDMVIWIKYVQ